MQAGDSRCPCPAFSLIAKKTNEVAECCERDTSAHPVPLIHFGPRQHRA